MTTPDPSREAFERHILSLNACTRLQRQSDQCGGAYRTVSVERSWKLWQAAMAHKGAELDQAHDARRQAQAELADMKEKRNRIGLDIDRALRGEVNEQSPIADRLKLIAAAAAPKQEGST